MSVDKKKQLHDLMKKYVDNNNCINISKFRQDNPSEYALLPHYFGSVNQAIEEYGWVKVIKTKGKEGNRVTLRNQLAYDMLKQMRKNKTLEDIAQTYGVTRPAINQLFKALEASMKAELEQENNENK